jgi:hypothetical protein
VCVCVRPRWRPRRRPRCKNLPSDRAKTGVRFGVFRPHFRENRVSSVQKADTRLPIPADFPLYRLHVVCAFVCLYVQLSDSVQLGVLAYFGEFGCL